MPYSKEAENASRAATTRAIIKLEGIGMYKAQNRRVMVEFLLKCGYSLETLAWMNDVRLNQKFDFHFEAETTKGSKTELERNWGNQALIVTDLDGQPGAYPGHYPKGADE